MPARCVPIAVCLCGSVSAEGSFKSPGKHETSENASASALCQSGVLKAARQWYEGKLMTEYEKAARPEDLTRLFVAAANARDADAIASLYEPDAVMADPHDHGREASTDRA